MPYVGGDEFLGVAREPVTRDPSEEESKAFSAVLRFLAVRDRCAADMDRKLADKGFDADTRAYAIERAQACGLLDDVRYAGSFIRMRVAQSKGRMRIERELEESGIALSDVPGWPDDFFEGESEANRAYASLVARPPRRSRDVRATAYRRLVRKGFAPSAARSAACRYAENDAYFSRMDEA